MQATIKILPGLTDDELLVRYKEMGSMDALGELYRRYMPLVYGVCLKYFKNAEDAKDAVVSVFEELVVKLKKHEVTNFKPWLHTVAKNHCLMKLRSTKNLQVELTENIVYSKEDLHPEDVMAKEAEFNKLEKCLDTLPAEQKQAVDLFYLQKKCYKEIAEQTGYEQGQVRSYIQNGRRNLKICMEKV